MDDLDHLLARLDRADHIFADRLFLDRPDELFDDRQRHIGLKERHADLTQSGGDIFLRQSAASGQPVKYAAQAVCQCVEHKLVSSFYARLNLQNGARSHHAQTKNAPLSEPSPGGGPRRSPIRKPNLYQSKRAS